MKFFLQPPFAKKFLTKGKPMIILHTNKGDIKIELD
ncbi:MAG: peptidyl-prolyl cis-trans isomerase, partial [Neisseria sp.]